MRLSINISQPLWERWFVSVTLVLAFILLLVTTVQSLDYIDIVSMLTVTFINWIGSVLVGLRKY